MFENSDYVVEELNFINNHLTLIDIPFKSRRHLINTVSGAFFWPPIIVRPNFAHKNRTRMLDDRLDFSYYNFIECHIMRMRFVVKARVECYHSSRSKIIYGITWYTHCTSVGTGEL